jgi:hypothetical protein
MRTGGDATPGSNARPAGSWVAYAAAAWSLIFGVLHAVWAAGWYVGLPAAQAQKAFERTWFLVYDLVVAGLCGLGVFVAAALARGGARAGRLLGLLASVGAAVLGLRAVGAVVETLYLVAAGRYVFEPMHLYTLWFGMGAFFFALTARRFWRGRSAGTARAVA